MYLFIIMFQTLLHELFFFFLSFRTHSWTHGNCQWCLSLPKMYANGIGIYIYICFVVYLKTTYERYGRSSRCHHEETGKSSTHFSFLDIRIRFLFVLCFCAVHTWVDVGARPHTLWCGEFLVWHTRCLYSNTIFVN